jgi:hypothetical protein
MNLSGSELTEATRREGGIDLGAELTASIATALEKQGYRIASPTTVPRARRRPRPSPTMPAFERQARTPFSILS